MSDHAASSFIYSTLAGDATLNGLVGTKIYEAIAPPDAALPYVIFAEYSTREVLGMGANRLWADDMWIVRGVARQESYVTNPLKGIADRINALLHKSSGTDSYGTVWACVREERVRYPEIDEAGQQVRHLGGIYRIMAT